VNEVIEFKVLQDFHLWVKFQDGFAQSLDIKPFLGNGFTAELLNPAEFKKVHIESGGGLEWENGFDLCPNFLRELIENKKQIA
jgi:hypothetical protein